MSKPAKKGGVCRVCGSVDPGATVLKIKSGFTIRPEHLTQLAQAGNAEILKNSVGWANKEHTICSSCDALSLQLRIEVIGHRYMREARIAMINEISGMLTRELLGEGTQKEGGSRGKK
jgi:hypothetical protein